MSEQGLSWTSSQKRAFGYIQKGVADGLSASDGLRQYRAGGGAIRDSSWFSLYKQTTNLEGWKKTVKALPTTYMVRENMHLETDWDWREEYIMQMKVSGYSEEIGQRITKYITVESDKLLTKQEWRWFGQQAVDDTLGSIPFIIDRFDEYTPLHRVR